MLVEEGHIPQVGKVVIEQHGHLEVAGARPCTLPGRVQLLLRSAACHIVHNRRWRSRSRSHNEGKESIAYSDSSQRRGRPQGIAPTMDEGNAQLPNFVS
jgi:hypothetical protein